ncbi:MAG: 2-hydroxycarboxylate transporter family protein [Tissierellia bacterium]|nr:2-hydroxycarboxylate transporter family protein [Tissierellia bacterium]
MNEIRIAGLRLPIYAILLIITIIAMFLDVLPGGMVGAFLFLIIFGELLNLLGNKLPIIKTYLGGGAIVSIFGGAALVYFNVLPEPVVETTTTFMKDGGFLNFYIAALITGSILGMNRKLLINAAIRYLPCIIGAVAMAIILVSGAAAIMGYGAKEAIAYVGIPIMGGGMGAGAVPISKVFEAALNTPADTIMGRLVPAVALGNAMAIVAGGLLNRLGNVKPSLTGNGQLVRTEDKSLIAEKKEVRPLKNLTDYGTGIVLATCFFTFGAIVSHLLKQIGLDIHTYAWMIIAVAVVKATNIMPEELEEKCEGWYNFVAKNFTAALMLGIGVAYTDLGDIISAFTPTYVVLVFFVILGAIIGAGVIGHFVGFHVIESAITAGLCMANMGGTGDVAVLTASDRMELMPFAQISSRLGGAFIILVASFLVPLFFG